MIPDAGFNPRSDFRIGPVDAMLLPQCLKETFQGNGRY